MGVGVLAVGLVAVVVVLAVGGGGDQPEAAGVQANATATTVLPPTTTVEQWTAAEAFGQAGVRLETAGSFGYAGTSSVTDVNTVRPGMWLTVDLTVTGEVDLLSGRLHELGVAANGRASETVTDGMVVYGRQATNEQSVTTRTYQTVTELGTTPARIGAALLPLWLGSTADRLELAPDEQGQRTFRGTLVASVLGEIVEGQPAVDAEMLLTIDAAGYPIRIEVTTVPDGPPLHLAYDITRLGEPVAITLPGEG